MQVLKYELNADMMTVFKRLAQRVRQQNERPVIPRQSTPPVA